MSVLGAFFVSGLLHEYITIGDFDVWSGENFFFFMIHGVILILWEILFGYEKNNNNNNNTIISRFLKWVLLLVINLLFLPAHVEPLITNFKFSDVSTYFSQYYLNQ